MTGLAYSVTVFFVLTATGGAALVFAFSSPPHVAAAVALAVLIFLVAVSSWLLGLYLYGALLIGSDRLGIGAMLNPRRLWKIARTNHDASVRLGVTYLVAGLGFGLIGVAVSFVIPFASLVIQLALPGVFAVLVPTLVRFEVATASVAEAR